MERTMDLIAGTLGLEPAEVRRRNMIRPDEMPYPMGVPYRDGEPIVYDSGDLSRRTGEGARCHRWSSCIPCCASATPAQHGRYLGLGIALLCRRYWRRAVRERDWCALNRPGRSTLPRAHVRKDRVWKRSSLRWLPTPGRSIPTDVVISLADTSVIAIGFGTIASRSTVTLSAAIYYASERLRTRSSRLPPICWNARQADLELRNGKVGVVGVPGMEVTLASVAQAARPGWDHRRPDGIDAGLEESFYWEPPTVTWANGTTLRWLT